VSQKIPTRRVFISYSSQEPDVSLAQAFRGKITGAGHHCFMAGECLRLGDNWPERTDSELEQCDYFLLLLSLRAAKSDMVIEEVRRAKLLHDARPNQRPGILHVRICLPPDASINYDLASYISRFQRAEWRSEADTERVGDLILEAIASGAPLLNKADQPDPQSSRRNKGLPPWLYHSLRQVLIDECEEFTNHAHLLSLFTIGNLSIWRKYLPPPGNLNVTVDKVIGELAKRNTRSGENALASLLLVLAERRDSDDELHNCLLALSRQCQQILSDN
jgi:hypothetical protein